MILPERGRIQDADVTALSNGSVTSGRSTSTMSQPSTVAGRTGRAGEVLEV
ncbi:hypothetical protein [Actinophytocola gossypii]|uniref:Uncharacterized protein n=1 Tax=Actinophytocola gossypii TaxID=2812003 RepID=A0ABT2JB99_9PSEU|nr:hypothetical protein [Actinophytocola gossypii]MCT2584839.1 hypothetical protein [Actinophytocola gossypii]